MMIAPSPLEGRERPPAAVTRPGRLLPFVAFEGRGRWWYSLDGGETWLNRPGPCPAPVAEPEPEPKPVPPAEQLPLLVLMGGR